METVHHGRIPLFEDLDLSRTAGWLMVNTPVLLDLCQIETPQELLRTVQAQVQAIPNMGVGYELLRYFRADMEITRPFQAHPRPEVMFNYYPAQDLPKSAVFLPAQESVEAGRNLKNLRYKLLEIKASIVQGQLVTSWSYSTQLYRPTTIEALSGRFLEVIRTFIAETHL